MGFMAPSSAFPGQTAAIGVTAEIPFGHTAADNAWALLRAPDLPRLCRRRLARSRSALGLPLFRGRLVWLLCLYLYLYRQGKNGSERYQRNGDPRALEGTKGLVVLPTAK